MLQLLDVAGLALKKSKMIGTAAAGHGGRAPITGNFTQCCETKIFTHLFHSVARNNRIFGSSAEQSIGLRILNSLVECNLCCRFANGQIAFVCRNRQKSRETSMLQFCCGVVGPKVPSSGTQL